MVVVGRSSGGVNSSVSNTGGVGSSGGGEYIVVVHSSRSVSSGYSNGNRW